MSERIVLDIKQQTASGACIRHHGNGKRKPATNLAELAQYILVCKVYRKQMPNFLSLLIIGIGIWK